MTQFIESISTHQLLPPYQSINSQVNGFLFDIGADAIAAYCDRFLNLGDPLERGFIYKPLYAAPFGLLTLTQYPSMCSLDRLVPKSFGVSAGEWDHLQQNEFFCAVPVYRYRLTPANIMFDPVIRWIQPFIVVDNATSAFSGREILGLDMLYGHIDVGDGAKPGGMSVNVSVPAWETFRPDCPQKMAPFIEVQMGPPLENDGSPDSQAAMESLSLNTGGVIAQLQAAIPALGSIAHGVFPEAMDLVILKQFRAAGDPYTAIYQALVGARCRYSEVSELKLYDASTVSVQFMGGDMVDEIIRTFLNLAPSWPGTMDLQPLLTPKMAFSAPPPPPPPTLANIRMAFSLRFVMARP